MKIQKILCPTDFSEHSEQALEHGAGLAKLLDAQLIIAHCVEPVIYPVAYGLAPLGNRNYEEEAREAAEAKIAPLVDKLESDGVKASSLVVTGTAWLRLCEVAEEEGADLMVMATHGYTGLKHVLLGSTAEHVVRHCPCPVLTVKSHIKD